MYFAIWNRVIKNNYIFIEKRQINISLICVKIFDNKRFDKLDRGGYNISDYKKKI